LRAAYEKEALSPEEKSRLEKDPAWFGEIYIMNADGSEPRRLTNTPGYDGGPFFSPDGERIIWRRFDEKGMIADVFTMKTDGSDVQRVTDFQAMAWAPFYHPSGQYVIFTSNKFGFENFELFLADARGDKEPVRITTTDGFDGLPVFAPDGKRLSWTSNRTADKKSQLFLADWNHPAALKAIGDAPARTRRADELQAQEAQRAAKQNYIAEQEAALSPLPEAKPKLQLPDAAGTVTSEIAAADLQAQVKWIADPKREGRLTGSPGAHASAEFLASYFDQLGLKKVGESYFQEFEFTAGVRALPEQNRLTITREGEAEPRALSYDQHFRPLAFSDSGEAKGEVVFAGYGLSVPEDGKGPRYNSYDGLDVSGKVVLLLRYVPEAVSPERRAQLNRYAGLRYKAMLARERGAAAVLFVSGPNSPQAGELLPLTGDGSLAGSGVVAHSISAEAAEALLAGSGKSLKELQTELDTENPHASGGFVLPKVQVQLAAGVEQIKKRDRNVLALLPPAEGATDEYIVLGAHYDHLGRGSGSNSMARSGEEEQIHFGADDNASGVAAIMELAAALTQNASSTRRNSSVASCLPFGRAKRWASSAPAPSLRSNLCRSRRSRRI
jgi:hypothetical protein